MSFNSGRKLFRDTVHGYISIPEIYCDNIIDTPIFQRLRRIEQTSMRTLFPCAHHDRFVHSLGTFHLGAQAFKYLKMNSKDEVEDLNEDAWELLQITFEIACLLHDCGHSPFSHSFEKYFDIPSNLDKRLKESAKNYKKDSTFGNDVDFNSAKPHEKVSALLTISKYYEACRKIHPDIDILLVARMIIGCHYRGEKSPKKQIANCLMDLLNGKSIDVDKLDYTARDKWASGFSSSAIDLERLLSAICIRKRNDNYVLCFHKSAISEIESVLDAKNFQHMWIISHHKVKYDQHLLTKSIEKLAEKITREDKDEQSIKESKREEALGNLFSIDIFNKPVKIGKYQFYLTTDDDLIYLMKLYQDEISYAKEWLNREHSLKPLWKTYNEYYSYFSDTDLEEQDYLGKNCAIRKNVETIIKKFLEESNIPQDNYYLSDINLKLSHICKNNIYILINKKVKCYTEIGIDVKKEQLSPFFLLFVPEALLNNKAKIINEIIASV